MIGRTYGQLLVLARSSEHPNKWLCRCACGQTTTVIAQSLYGGNTRSCGCLSSRLTIGERSKTHGASYSREHETWKAITQRCHNARSKNWNNYGGRGITVCARWVGPDGYRSFLSDMGSRPVGQSLDRIDNNGPYSPENCRWATREQQANNKRNVKQFVIDGQTRSLAQWAKLTGVKYSTAYMRLARGWAVERALQP